MRVTAQSRLQDKHIHHGSKIIDRTSVGARKHSTLCATHSLFRVALLLPDYKGFLRRTVSACNKQWREKRECRIDMENRVTGFSTSLVGIPDTNQGNGRKTFEVIMTENSKIEVTA